MDKFIERNCVRNCAAHKKAVPDDPIVPKQSQCHRLKRREPERGDAPNCVPFPFRFARSDDVLKQGFPVGCAEVLQVEIPIRQLKAINGTVGAGLDYPPQSPG